MMWKHGVSRPALIELCVLASLLLLVLLPVAGASGAASAGRPAETGRAAAADTTVDVKGWTFRITWNVTRKLNVNRTYLFSNSEFDRHRVLIEDFDYMTGSGVFSYQGGKWVASEFSQSFTANHFQETRYPNQACAAETRYEQTRETVTDPDRWMGASGMEASINVYRRADGSYYMPNPAGSFASLPYSFSRQTEWTQSPWYEGPCQVDSNNQTFDQLALYGGGAGNLTGDSTGQTFKVSRQFQSEEWPYYSTYTWNVTAQRLGGCKGGSAPIDSTNEATRHGYITVKLQTQQTAIDTDGSALLTAAVKCDGIPVSRALLRVGVDPEPRSGGHNHENEKNARPRGYLTGLQGGTATTARDSDIELTTDSNGVATIRFEPGRALGSKTYDKAGIAGTYHIRASAPDYDDVSHEKTIQVGVAGLESMTEGAGSPYLLQRLSEKTHPEGYAGTAATRNAIRQLAEGYISQQTQISNTAPFSTTAVGQRVRQLSVNDMSLPDGGVFDVRDDWQAPHQTHGQGFSFDVNRATFGGTLPQGPGSGTVDYETRKDILMSLGKQFGHWDKDDLQLKGGARYHLHVNQTSPARAIQASGPDLAVTALLSSPADRARATPGQTVTFTIGVNNMNGGADAHNVAVSASLPAGLTLAGTSPAATSVNAGQPVWNLGTLAAGASPQLLRLSAQVGAGVTPGTVLAMTAEASTSDSEADIGNNRDDQLGAVMVETPGADLAVNSDLDAVAMTVDQPVTFSLTVANQGNATATGTTLTATLPVSVTLSTSTPSVSSSTSGNLSWQLGSVAAGESRTVNVTVKLDPALTGLVASNPAVQAGGTLTYTFGVTATTADTDPDDNSRQSIKPVEFAGPDLRTWFNVEGEAEPGMLAASREVTYTVSYANYGSGVAPSTTLSVSLGSAVTLVQAQPAAGRTSTSAGFPGGILGWDLGNVATGASGAVTVRVLAGSLPEYGSLVVATVKTSARDIRLANNVYSDLFMAASSVSPVPGATATWTPTVTPSPSSGQTPTPGIPHASLLYLPVLMLNLNTTEPAPTPTPIAALTPIPTAGAPTPTPAPPTATPVQTTATPAPDPATPVPATVTPTVTPTPAPPTASPSPSPTPTPAPTATASPSPTPTPTATPTVSGSLAGDWPAFGRDAVHSRYNANETNLAPPLRVKWSYPTGSYITSSPVVSDGVVYFGSYDKKLYALNAVTGGLRWSYTAGDAIASSPAVANGVVYFGSHDGKLHAVNTDGTPRWTYSMSQSGARTSSPTVYNGVVYVGSYGNKLYAIKVDGTLLWSYPTGGIVESSPAVADGTVYIGSRNASLSVQASSGYKIHAVDAVTGVGKWTYDAGGYVRSSPSVANGAVYIGSDDGKVYALDKDGNLLWYRSTGNFVESSPAVANGVVYVGSYDGRLYALNPLTGDVILSPLMAGIKSSPAIANGYAYVGSNDAKLYAMKVSDGTVWSYTLPQAVESSPAVANGILYVGSLDNKLYAFEKAN